MLDIADKETGSDADELESSSGLDLRAAGAAGAEEAVANGLVVAPCEITADKTRLVDHTEAVLVEVLRTAAVAAKADAVGPAVAAVGPSTGTATLALPDADEAEEAREEAEEECKADIMSSPLITAELETLAGAAEPREDATATAADCTEIAVGSEDGLAFNLEARVSEFGAFSDGFTCDPEEAALAVDGTAVLAKETSVRREQIGSVWCPASTTASDAT